MQLLTSTKFSKLDLDDLEHQIINLSVRINSSEYEFLVLLREFDLRQGWKAWGCLDCAAWLNFRCGIVPGTAREKVRTARALIGLPLISNCFAEGKLSYSNVRALTRVATPENEKDLLEFAVGATASQVEQRCRQIRNGDRELSSGDANRIHQRRWLSRTRNADGSMSISIDLPGEQGELVMKAIEFALSVEQSVEHSAGLQVDGTAGSESLFALQADALVCLAKSYLSGGKQSDTDLSDADLSDADLSNANLSNANLSNVRRGKSSSADNYQVIVHVDESALKNAGGESDLPIESVRRLTCDGSVLAVIQDAFGEPLNVGRKHRTVHPALKRGLLARDKQCCFPGCSHDRWIDAHHVHHWAEGGETNPANLILLCSAHHRMVHEGGFSIEKDFEGQWYFLRPDGRPIAHGPVYTEPVSGETMVRTAPDLTDDYVSPETFHNGEGIEEPMAAYG